jgi:hypothetical protein
VIGGISISEKGIFAELTPALGLAKGAQLRIIVCYCNSVVIEPDSLDFRTTCPKAADHERKIFFWYMREVDV